MAELPLYGVFITSCSLEHKNSAYSQNLLSWLEFSYSEEME